MWESPRRRPLLSQNSLNNVTIMFWLPLHLKLDILQICFDNVLVYSILIDDYDNDAYSLKKKDLVLFFTFNFI